MKKHFCIGFAALCFFSLPLSAQRMVVLRNAVVPAENNINAAFIAALNRTLKKVEGKSYVLLQFQKRPGEQEKNELAKAGIQLLQYLSSNVFLASIEKPLETTVLMRTAAVSIMEVKAEHKIDRALLTSANPSAKEVLVSLFPGVSYQAALSLLHGEGYSVTDTSLENYGIVQVGVTGEKIIPLASLPFVQSLEEKPALTELNLIGRTNARANVLNTGIPGSYNLTGEGVTVGIGEVANLQPHVDFKDRTNLDLASNTNNYHSTHVHGIVGGAGLIDEQYTGFAPRARLLSLGGSQTVSSDINNQRAGMVLSNNSYAIGSPCNQLPYSILNYVADKQAFDLNYLQHVFAAGNSGTTNCTFYPAGFNTVLSNYQSAKSILTVGNTLSNGDLSPSSSRGPAAGGRMKPEIVATGTNVISTVPNDTYGSNTGTSMASPAVAGGLALLYQRYRHLHGGKNPRNSLMKAILCNTATDLGNPGPDFLYGFGWMHLSRAVQALDGSFYFEDSVKQAANKTHTIKIPEGTAQLKIMLYWPDPPASTLSGRALVNDLDLSVSSPDGNVVLPWVLDTTPSRVANIATRGEDHINNVEQVVIDRPLSGTYTIKVKGTEIPLDPSQQYVITYDIVPEEVRLTYPVGNESLVPGETVNIQWDSWGVSSSTFSLQYSIDKGSTWQDIANTIAATNRQFDWLVPAAVTSQAVIRVTRNSDSKTHVSGPFVILGTPSLSLNAVQCPGYISINWMAVTGATHYEIMKVENGETVRVDTTSSLFYTFKNLSENVTYWVSVRACLNESHGRRSRALSRLPKDGNCTGSISDKDLKMDSILSPLVGREHTSLRLGKREVIRVRIKNLDDAPVTGLTLGYSVNGGAWVKESTPLTIAALATTVFDFSAPYDFSLPGNYRIVIAVNLPGDTNPGNDTLRYTIRHLVNPPVGLSSSVLDDFESTTPSVFTASYMGVEGASRFDVDRPSPRGGVEVVSKGLSDTSGQALRLIRPEMGSNYLIATYNLSLYDTSSHNIGLEFTYSKVGSIGLNEDSVWIRGNDTAPWTAVMNLDPGLTGSVTNKKTNTIEVGNNLRAAGQNYSSSFQVRWGQHNSYNDYVLDNIRLFDISKDVALLHIDSLPEGSYRLSSATPLRVTIRNHSRLPIAALPLKYRINGGSLITDTVRNVPSNNTMPFTFSRLIDLSALGVHYIEVWTDWADDNYPSNNYLTLSLQHQPLVTEFPYLENFEKSNGWWYAKGVNSSWQYGEPRSGKITGAASGTNAWKTNLAGKYNDSELSYLYSPFFDLDGLTRPMISFSLALNTDSCAGAPCDYVALEFSTNGLDWKNVVPFSQSGFNWASRMQSKTNSRWHVATTALPDSAGVVQFRFLFRTDPYTAYEGVGIDDVHIYDSTAAIYDGPESPQAITQVVSGRGWIDFKQNSQLLLSLFPNGQNLGNVTAQAYLQNGPVKNFHGQHYLSRNYVIQPGVSSLNDSIGVRLYFLDKETDALFFTPACPSCPKPAHAYHFGISQYFSPKSGELNGQLPDNIKGVWSYTSFHDVKTVPYQKGYYLEFKVKDFSELWVNSGGYDQNSYLPLRLLDYTVKKPSPQKVMIQWRTASEINMQRFEIEVAKGNKAFEQDAYEKVGEVLSKGASRQPQDYMQELMVQEPKGIYYYRLKMLDEFGNFSYSKALPVVLSPEMEWKIAPNVSLGVFTLSYQLSEEQKVTAEIFNAVGSLVKKEQFEGNGFIQKHVFDLSSGRYAKGIYWIRINGGGEEHLFKVVKQ